jgi:hypothetical protein
MQPHVPGLLSTTGAGRLIARFFGRFDMWTRRVPRPSGQPGQSEAPTSAAGHFYNFRSGLQYCTALQMSSAVTSEP